MASEAPRVYKPHPEDVKSPDAIIRAMYEIISGPAGKRNWQRLRSLYLPGARLIPTGERIHKKGELQVLTLDEWIEDVKDFFTDKDFYESEIVRHTDHFGSILQAFSTYVAKNDPEGPIIARGINSIQLLHHENRWWIVTVMWENESKDNPVPEEFLPYLW